MPGSQEDSPDLLRSRMVLAKLKVVRDAGAGNRHLVAVLTALCVPAGKSGPLESNEELPKPIGHRKYKKGKSFLEEGQERQMK